MRVDRRTEWAERAIGQPEDIDVELDPISVGSGCARNISTDCAFLRVGENGLIGDTGWIAPDLFRGTEFPCRARNWSWSLCVDESQAAQGSDEERGMHY